MKALADNDILLKGTCYGLLDELVFPVCTARCLIGVLGTARFVVPARLRKVALKKKVAKVLENFDAFLQDSSIVEPTDDERALAAEFEFTAQREGLNLHSGESQLCAITISRRTPWLLTGDKRAIQAIENLLNNDSRLRVLSGKVKCLEQLVLRLLNISKGSVLRQAICAEPDIDKTLTICFSCTSEISGQGSLSQALEKYIADLRNHASRVLAH